MPALRISPHCRSISNGPNRARCECVGIGSAIRHPGRRIRGKFIPGNALIKADAEIRFVLTHGVILQIRQGFAAHPELTFAALT